MKTTFILSLMAASLAAPSTPAQVTLYGAEPVPQPVAVSVPAVVYEAPVVYQAPVIYQAPVVYQAPPVCPAPVVNGGCLLFGGGGTACTPPSASVLYIGGPGAEYRNSFQANPAAPVIYFGRGEGYQRGYNFLHSR